MHCRVFLKVTLFLPLNPQGGSLRIIPPSREGSTQTDPANPAGSNIEKQIMHRHLPPAGQRSQQRLHGPEG